MEGHVSGLPIGDAEVLNRNPPVKKVNAAADAKGVEKLIKKTK